jgi:hypothetical protein
VGSAGLERQIVVGQRTFAGNLGLGELAFAKRTTQDPARHFPVPSTIGTASGLVHNQLEAVAASVSSRTGKVESGGKETDEQKAESAKIGVKTV